IEWNRDFRVARWSREAETLFGWQAAEVLGKLPSEWNFVFPEDRATVSQVIDQLIDGSQQRNVALNRNYTKDDKVVYCEWYNSGLLDEAGNLVSVLSLILDVTQQKQTEAELVHRAAELVRLTTMLAQTNYDLQKRNQELDEFSYVVSHDLKAPLRAIANLSEWIEEDLEESLTEETRQQMNLLRGRVYRMEALINGLLQYSRVGRVETPMTSVSVATLLAEVIDSLDPPATFTIKVSPNMPTLWTYRLLLEQVFSNLISNAIKHHPRLDGTIHISSIDVGDFYQFTVADDGDGIAPEYQAKVFGIFQTLSARDQKENTGIGLSIVKKIVESQGGSIWLESQAGQGAAFYFTWLKTQN
ncbi:PAS domain-containing sensor histidine kinase, partial [Gloeocapsopsis crepidinum]